MPHVAAPWMMLPRRFDHEEQQRAPCWVCLAMNGIKKEEESILDKLID
jgi:hypothetical protein